MRPDYAVDVTSVDWAKMGGLVPAIVQDAGSGQILMLGYMNQDALERTIETGRATFFSRSRGRLWEKGETSGNTLHVVDISVDCDGDTLLLLARPDGPTCHLGSNSCFGETNAVFAVFSYLEQIIDERSKSGTEKSYTRSLLESGAGRIAQKVGEEAVEVVVAALEGTPEDLLDEAADLVYHLLVLLRYGNVGMSDVASILLNRRRQSEKHYPDDA